MFPWGNTCEQSAARVGRKPQVHSTITLPQRAAHQPPVHWNVAAVSPAVGHCMPAVQGAHWEASVAPIAAEKVPGGQSVAAEAPDRQNDPAGHALPVVPSLGVGVVAPPRQRQPALQGPVGAARPVPAQNAPGLQGMHAASDAPSVRLRNVPRGHGKAAEEFVPRGQTNPAGQATGVTVAPSQ